MTSRQNISSKTGIFGIRSFRQSFYNLSTLSTMSKDCRKLSSCFRHRMPTFRQPFNNLLTIDAYQNDHENVDILPSFRQFGGNLWKHCVRALMSLLYRHPMCDTTCRARELGHCDAHSNTISEYFDLFIVCVVLISPSPEPAMRVSSRVRRSLLLMTGSVGTSRNHMAGKGCGMCSNPLHDGYRRLFQQQHC